MMGRRSEPVDSPLFPRCLFVNCDLGQDGVSSFSEVPHILGWVQFSGLVPSVDDEVINALAQRVEMANCEGGLWTRFRPGRTVRVASRSINGLGEVVKDTRSPRANVMGLIEFMGRLMPAQVRREDLVPIEVTSSETIRLPRRTRGRRRWVRSFGPAGLATA